MDNTKENKKSKVESNKSQSGISHDMGSGSNDIEPKNINLEQTARLRIIKSEDFEKNKKSKKFINKPSIKPMKMSSMYKKKYGILALIVLLVFIFAYQFVKVKEVDFAKLEKQLTEKLGDTELEIGDEASLRKVYGINKIEVEGFVSFVPSSNMDANEILVIKAKPEYAGAIEKRIQSRIDSQLKSFKNYAPEQYEILNKNEFVRKGDYIYFISYKDKNIIDETIKNSYK